MLQFFKPEISLLNLGQSVRGLATAVITCAIYNSIAATRKIYKKSFLVFYILNFLITFRKSISNFYL